MLRLALSFAWWWMLAGLLAGTIHGLWFHRPDWLGGYASWARRLTRLGHISFLGTALILVAFVLSASALGIDAATLTVPCALLVAGALTMPPVCYLAAWRARLRPLFVLPVGTLVSGVAAFAFDLLQHRLP